MRLGPRVRRLARTLLGVLPRGLALPILAGPLRGKLWIVRSSNYSCWIGTYEREKVRSFAAELGPGAVVFDVGAHVGFYSLLSAVLVAPGGKVYAFEPLRSNTVKLRRHVAMNGLPVEVVEAAVADEPGDAYFQQGRDSYTGALASRGDHVSVVSLDSFRADHETPDPSVLKIDVEGAEALVLKGAAQTIKDSRPVIYLAVHGNAVRGECLALLASFGYLTDPLNGHGIEPGTEFVCRPVGARNSAQPLSSS